MAFEANNQTEHLSRCSSVALRWERSLVSAEPRQSGLAPHPRGTNHHVPRVRCLVFKFIAQVVKT